MPSITLLAKAYNGSQLKQINDLLKTELEGLKVEIHITGTTANGWIQTTVAGEDEKVAVRFLTEKIGLCPERFEQIRKFSTIKGQITALNMSRDELSLDIGIFSPTIINAAIPLHVLQAQLGDGRKLALRKFIELFGFCEELPLTIKISSVDSDSHRVEAMLSDMQLDRYGKWTDSLLDRLIILGAPRHEIESALEKAGFERDVAEIQELGLFEHAVACKLGTDAAGLIPRIGRRLRDATFTIFNPRRIAKFFEEDNAT